MLWEFFIALIKKGQTTCLADGEHDWEKNDTKLMYNLLIVFVYKLSPLYCLPFAVYKIKKRKKNTSRTVLDECLPILAVFSTCTEPYAVNIIGYIHKLFAILYW